MRKIIGFASSVFLIAALALAILTGAAGAVSASKLAQWKEPLVTEQPAQLLHE